VFDLATGTIVDERFEIIDELGQGGMGVVYRARHLQMDKIIALKLLRVQLSAESDKLLRFKREAQLLSVLNHPNILQVFAIGLASEETPYIAMEFLSGSQLSDVLEKDGPMDWRALLPLMIEVCSALDYAHGKEIIHRDIKPSNIMLVESHAKVVDFGIAKSIGESAPKLTQTNMLMGSVFYMSPTDFAGLKPGPHTDIYALGCTMFEMLAGKPPFTGDTVFDTMARHTEDPVPEINKENPKANIPESLQRLVEWMLAKNIQDRAPSAAVVQTHLEAILAGRSVSIKNLRKSTQNGYWLWISAVIVVGGIIVWYIGAAFQHPPHTRSKASVQQPLLTKNPKEKTQVDYIIDANTANIDSHYTELGNVYLHEPLPTAAILCYLKGLSETRNDQKRAMFHNLLAAGYGMRGEFSRSVDEFEKCISLNKKLNRPIDIQDAGLIRAYVPLNRMSDAMKVLPPVEARLSTEADIDKQIESELILSYAIEAAIKTGNLAHAETLIALARKRGELARRVTRLPEALSLVQRSYEGDKTRAIDISALRRNINPANEEPGMVDLALGWALAEQSPAQAVELGIAGLDAVSNSPRQIDVPEHLRILFDAGRYSQYILDRLPKTFKAAAGLRAKRDASRVLRDQVQQELINKGRNVPVDVSLPTTNQPTQP
jgi:serine/threonine protein kinase